MPIFTNRRSVNALAADPTGKTVLSGSWDCSVRLFDCRNGEELARFSGHKKPVNSVAFHPEGQVTLSGSWDGLHMQ